MSCAVWTTPFDAAIAGLWLNKKNLEDRQIVESICTLHIYMKLVYIRFEIFFSHA